MCHPCKNKLYFGGVYSVLGHMYLFVSKNQEIVVEKVVKIVQMLDISNFLLQYLVKKG